MDMAPIETLQLKKNPLCRVLGPVLLSSHPVAARIGKVESDDRVNSYETFLSDLRVEEPEFPKEVAHSKHGLAKLRGIIRSSMLLLNV